MIPQDVHEELFAGQSLDRGLALYNVLGSWITWFVAECASTAVCTPIASNSVGSPCNAPGLPTWLKVDASDGLPTQVWNNRPEMFTDPSCSSGNRCADPLDGVCGAVGMVSCGSPLRCVPLGTTAAGETCAEDFAAAAGSAASDCPLGCTYLASWQDRVEMDACSNLKPKGDTSDTILLSLTAPVRAGTYAHELDIFSGMYPKANTALDGAPLLAKEQSNKWTVHVTMTVLPGPPNMTTTSLEPVPLSGPALVSGGRVKTVVHIRDKYANEITDSCLGDYFSVKCLGCIPTTTFFGMSSTIDELHHVDNQYYATHSLNGSDMNHSVILLASDVCQVLEDDDLVYYTQDGICDDDAREGGVCDAGVSTQAIHTIT